MASPTPFAHHTLSVEGCDLHHEQSHEVDSHIKNPSTKWVLNSPDPPGFCQHIFSSIKKTVFPQRNHVHSSSSSSQKKQSPCERIIVVLSSVFPVLIWGRKYTASKFKNDLIAGLTLASLSIPQSIGYAALANLAPQYGLYGSVVPPLIYSVMGTSQELAIGPVAVVSLLISLMISKLVDPVADPVSYMKLVFTVTFFTGTFQALFGLLRLGFLIDFLSHAAIVGFMAGAAIVIGLQQLKSLLGISHFTTKTDVVSVLDAVIKSFHTSLYPLNFVIGCSFLIFILITRFIGKRNKKLFWLPAISPVISVILSTLIVYLSRADEHGVKIIKHFKGGLNPSSLNQLEFNGPHLGEAAKAGFICAIIALTEAVAVGRSFASIKGYNLDGNKEMLAMGFMNIAGSMSSCYVSTGSFSRTAVNFSAGCQSTVSNIVMAITVFISLQLLTKLLYYTPLAILASIIMSALPGLIDYNEACHIWKVDKMDFLACIGAFFGVLFASVEIGLLVAVSLIHRGANDFMLDEMDRALHDALCIVKRTLESNTVVPGGGAVEAALSVYLEDLATTLGSREQLAIAEFAKSLLIIPKVLAVNAAKDATDLVAKLRAKYNTAQTEADKKHLSRRGLDLVRGTVRNNLEAGVIEPAMSKVKILHLDVVDKHLKSLRDVVLQNCRKMSTEEKKALMTVLTQLSPEDLNKALLIVAQSNPNFQATGQEVDLDIDAQSEATLWKLKFFVKDLLQAQGKSPRSIADGNL